MDSRDFGFGQLFRVFEPFNFLRERVWGNGSA